MLSKLKRFIKFTNITGLNDLHKDNLDNTIFRLNPSLDDGIFYTPILQKYKPDDYYLEYLDDLRFLKTTKKTTNELVHSLLNESLKDSKDISIGNNYFIKDDYFNGFIDYIIFKDNIPIASVINMEIIKDLDLNVTKYNENLLIQPIIIDYFLKKFGLESFICWLTNGHFWKFSRGYSDSKYQKTIWYKPLAYEIIKHKLNNPFFKFGFNESSDSKRIWYDLEFLEIILGLIRYSSNFKTKQDLQIENLYNDWDHIKYLNNN